MPLALVYFLTSVRSQDKVEAGVCVVRWGGGGEVTTVPFNFNMLGNCMTSALV